MHSTMRKLSEQICTFPGSAGILSLKYTSFSLPHFQHMVAFHFLSNGSFSVGSLYRLAVWLLRTLWLCMLGITQLLAR
jgi:hypothetical protein